jgi:peptide-methionine (S)-S-oxide reductase
VRTRVGYAGGRTVEPTYHALADHTEVFQVDYDPRLASFGDLLELVRPRVPVRDAGLPTGRHRQYMSAVFAATDAQAAEVRARGIGLPTIVGARFYRAEDYHQKYHLRHDSILMAELADYSPRELADSTVAARLNGYVCGHGSAAQLREEPLGLSPRAHAHLEQLVSQRSRRMLCT